MRAILDTNVLVSGILFGGIPRKILECAQRRTFTMVITHDILSEYYEVIERVSKEYNVKRASSVLESIISKAELSFSITLHEPVCIDPDDDIFFAAAKAAKVKIIVSGDKHLKAASGWSGVKVISPATFYKLISKR